MTDEKRFYLTTRLSQVYDEIEHMEDTLQGCDWC